MGQFGHPAPVALRYDSYKDLRKVNRGHGEGKRYHGEEEELLIASEFAQVGQNVVKVQILIGAWTGTIP